MDWAWDDTTDAANIFRTFNGPSCFVVAADFESSNGSDISGINGEEQNDIALTLNYSGTQDPKSQFYTFIIDH
jgi:hypothetical protein